MATTMQTESKKQMATLMATEKKEWMALPTPTKKTFPCHCLLCKWLLPKETQDQDLLQKVMPNFFFGFNACLIICFCLKRVLILLAHFTYQQTVMALAK